ncbi:hypothetical protein [Streptomyces griseoluteus]
MLMSRHTAWQFLIESATLGLIGEISGTSLGMGIVVGVSLCNECTPRS